MRALQRLVVLTSRTPLRRVWALAYGLLARAFAGLLSGPRSGATVYARGSLAAGDPVFGLADVDLTVVVPSDRARVLARWDRVPSFLRETLLDKPHVLERREFLERGDGPIYFGGTSHADIVRLHERPGLYGRAEIGRAHV